MGLRRDEESDSRERVNLGQVQALDVLQGGAGSFCLRGNQQCSFGIQVTTAGMKLDKSPSVQFHMEPHTTLALQGMAICK